MRRTIVFTYEHGAMASLRVSASLKAMRIYRSEFNADLAQDLEACRNAIHPDVFTEAAKRAGIVPGTMSAEEIQKKILENIDLSTLSGRESVLPEAIQVKVVQVMYACVKAADDGNKVDSFEEFADSLEDVKISELFERLYELWTGACGTTIELKN